MARLLLLVALSSGLAAVAWGCGGSVDGQGTIASPNYPSNYPPSSSCTWVLAAESGKTVRLKFNAFSLELGYPCAYDYVKVYDGPTTSSTLLGSFCGSSIPADVSGGNVMTVVFKSDGNLEMSGFSAQFQSVDSTGVPATTTKPSGGGGGGSGCGGDYAASTGTLSSPGHPSLYPNSASCEYTITVPRSKVVLAFTTIDIESSSSCSYDYLEVRESGPSGNLLAKVCGNSLPGNIISLGSRLYLKFVSDSSVQKTGFLASWTELTCESKGGSCVSAENCEGKPDNSLICQSDNDVCCFPDIQQGGCGVVPASRIIGGNESKPNGWPWQASLQQTSNSFHFCGGSVIAAQWVVTAAHCVNGKTASAMQVVVGEHDLKEKGNEQILRIKSITMHESYNGNAAGFPNDIALIQLQTPIEFSRYVQPACLPELMEEFLPTDDCWITGWGDTKGTGESTKLQQLKIDVIPRPDCRVKWGASYINEGHVCLGNGLKGACNGDSGGPLACERVKDGKSRWVLAGATSWGRSGCQTEGFPSVYTRISYFLQWIENKIRSTL